MSDLRSKKRQLIWELWILNDNRVHRGSRLHFKVEGSLATQVLALMRIWMRAPMYIPVGAFRFQPPFTAGSSGRHPHCMGLWSWKQGSMIGQSQARLSIRLRGLTDRTVRPCWSNAGLWFARAALCFRISNCIIPIRIACTDVQYCVCYLIPRGSVSHFRLSLLVVRSHVDIAGRGTAHIRYIWED